ncbi:MAG TPA: Ig-like domain-containing protein [candidate division Zixibacteria bacterium]
MDVPVRLRGCPLRNVAVLCVAWYGLVLHAGCARHGIPSGGPADETAPVVQRSVPTSGAVNTDRTTPIVIEFSEPVARETLAGQVTVSPARHGSPQIKWSDGDRTIRLTWTDTLRENTTYRVSLGAKLSDRRQNALKEPYTFAFGTGHRIDGGHIIGRVEPLDPAQRAAASWTVNAYQLEALPDTFWRATPAYTTRTGPEGRFDLPFLRAGEYRLLAFADRDNNAVHDPGESYGLPERNAIATDTSLPDSLSIFGFPYDTSTFCLRRCIATVQHGVTLTMTHPIDTMRLSESSIAVSDSAGEHPIAFALIPPTARRAAQLELLTEGLTAGQTIRVACAGLYDHRGQGLCADAECFTVVNDIRDTSGPTIVSVALPTVRVALTPFEPIRWEFSEPVDAQRLSDAVRVTDTLDAAIDGERIWRNPLLFDYVPANGWPDDGPVRARIDSAALFDRHGNAAPSQALEWVFEPLTAARMGRIEGDVTIADSSLNAAVCHITLRRTGTSTSTHIQRAGPGPFSVEIPGGNWQLSGYLDANGNGEFETGRLMPWQFAEPMTVHPDTLVVRPRFTLEDVELKFD